MSCAVYKMWLPLSQACFLPGSHGCTGSLCMENCPFSVMESQRYGTPIIASDMGGIPELVQDGVSGELFRAGDLTGLTEKIDKLWRQPALCRKYRKNCKNIKFDTPLIKPTLRIFAACPISSVRGPVPANTNDTCGSFWHARSNVPTPFSFGRMA